MIKALDRNYRDKLHRLLSVMLPIICTQIAIMGMNFFDASMSGQAGDRLITENVDEVMDQ